MYKYKRIFYCLLAFVLSAFIVSGCTSTPKSTDIHDYYSLKHVGPKLNKPLLQYCSDIVKSIFEPGIVAGYRYYPYIRVIPVSRNSRSNPPVGHCTLIYDVDESGVPVDIQIDRKDCTNKEFEEISLEVASSLKYCPMKLDGKSARVIKVKYRVNFNK